MIKTTETGMKRSMAMLAMITLIMMVTSRAQAADTFRPAQFQQQNIGHAPARNTVKKTVYHYVATTSKKARRQGKVNASGIVWTCKGTRCTISGPWPKPSVAACQKLANLVGSIHSYGRSGHYLSPNYIRQCNSKFVRHNSKKSAGAASHAKANLARKNTVSRLGDMDKQQASMFFARLPVDPVIKTKLSRSRDMRYLVVTNALSGRSHRIERRTWTGKILLPDLRKRGKVKPIHYTRKARKGRRSQKMTAWFIENPDGSLSKQIRNSKGRLAGNITFTRDGSVRIGIDLNGDQVADLYETIISSGEHTILASRAGQAALDHFRNGGKNPLCNPGAGSAGGGFAGGMISGGDKTAMQVVCGRKGHKPGNGGSAAGGSSGISGDPAGRAKDSMCRKVLSRHRGRPGNPSRVMGDPVGRGDDDPRVFHWGAALTSLFHSVIVSVIPGLSQADDVATVTGDNPGAAVVTVVGKVPGLGTAATATNAIGDALVAGGGHYVNEADRDLRHFEDAQDPGDNTHPNPAVVNAACSAGSSSHYCGAWHREHDSAGSGSGNNGSGNSSDPGPDQQNDPNAAMLSWCQARAKGKAWWASITKDTRYVRQLCENPASQPNPAGMTGSAGKAGSATLGDSYGSSITLSTYCGQHGGQGTSAPTPERLAGRAGGGRNCGRTESPGTDGKCHGVGTQFNGGNAGKVNISYGAVIGIPLFDPRVTTPP